MRRLSLRARLVLGVLVLGAAGLVAADAFTYTSLRSFLLDRVDSTLAAEHQGAERAGPDGFGPGGTGSDFVQIRAANGTTVLQTFPVRPFPGTTAPPQPKLPATISVPAEPSDGAPDRVSYFTVPATSGGERYRVRASVDPHSTDVLVIATSLSGVDGTLHRLFLIELFVSLAVLAGIAVLGLWIVRLGLRPLAAIETTADQIAGGDLSHRVETTDPRTEVGRLGVALNAMLDRLERAFAERRASENRLRQFIADASHELRTPLASIRGYAELFRIGAARQPAETEKAMRRIEDEAQRMGALVEDLLTLARVDEVPDAPRAPLDLAQLARDAVSDARATAPERAIELRVVGEATVLGDPHQLRQVLANLLRNALVHTPAGTAIDVSLERSGDQVVLTVRDHGPGLPTGDADALFERFWRAEGGRERGKGGAGLGLAIVAGIVDAHGGRVGARNAPGGGAAFVVRLPAAA